MGRPVHAGIVPLSIGPAGACNRGRRAEVLESRCWTVDILMTEWASALLLALGTIGSLREGSCWEREPGVYSKFENGLMDRFEDMRCFVAVVERGSVTKAADALRVAPSALSRRIKELEARLGTQLLARTTRRTRT